MSWIETIPMLLSLSELEDTIPMLLSLSELDRYDSDAIESK